MKKSTVIITIVGVIFFLTSIFLAFNPPELSASEFDKKEVAISQVECILTEKKFSENEIVYCAKTSKGEVIDVPVANDSIELGETIVVNRYKMESFLCDLSIYEIDSFESSTDASVLIQQHKPELVTAMIDNYSFILSALSALIGFCLLCYLVPAGYVIFCFYKERLQNNSKTLDKKYT